MRLQLLLLSAIGLMGVVCIAQNPRPKPKVSDQPLTPEQVAIYRVALKDYLKDSGDALNVSSTTEPFEYSKPFFHEECLGGIELEKPDAAAQVIHRLGLDVLINPKVVLVEPEQQRAKIRKNDPQNLVKKVVDEGEAVSDKQVEESVKLAFATGMFSLSEILIDKAHQHAVVSYAFDCGDLCGNGRILLLERTGEGWKVKNTCGEWVS